MAEMSLDGVGKAPQGKPQPALIERSGGNLVAQTAESGAGGVGDRGGAMNGSERSDSLSPEQFIDRRQFAKEFRSRGGFHFPDYPMKPRRQRPSRLQRVQVRQQVLDILRA